MNNAEAPTSGAVTLDVPAGWTSTPAQQPFAFARAGERATYRFTVRCPRSTHKAYAIEAVATAAGSSTAKATSSIDQRDLEVRYLYRPPTAEVRGIDVTVAAESQGRLRDGRRRPGAAGHRSSSARR